jgi:curved DNA-binding protein CbpA
MSTQKDHYNVLGVLPDAEHIVIVAAYRALASHYHPDRWKGDPNIATHKMAEINVAYGVVGDADKRKAYDATREKSHQTINDDGDETEAMFDQAVSEYEEKWNMACDIYPDLNDIRKRLSKTAHRLSFAFVIQVVEGKQYKNRHTLSKAMEDQFLTMYFGTNPQILDYARNLISFGFKDAVKRLNSLVDLLGNDLESDVVIKKVDDEFGLVTRRAEIVEEKIDTEGKAARFKHLKRIIANLDYCSETFEYARLLGYKIDIKDGGLFSPKQYSIRSTDNEIPLFSTHSFNQMSIWIKRNIYEKNK